MPSKRPHRQGLGYAKSNTTRPLSQRQQIVSLHTSEVEHKRLMRAGMYDMQTAWYTWGLENTMQHDLSWRQMLHQYSDRLLRFVLNQRLNTLPSPDNLRRWGQAQLQKCMLCGKVGATMAHILAGCPWVLMSEHQEK